MKASVKFFIALLGLAFALQAAANSGAAKVAEGVNYIPLEPALVVNYGGPGKARFIKAEISVRTETGEDAAEVIHHLPLIRDRLVSILSAQTEEAISTAEGKEYLRVYALAEINKALLKVEGHSVDEHDEKPGAAPQKSSAAVKSVAATTSSAKVATLDEALAEAPAPAPAAAEPQVAVVPSIADIKPVKGPASDLFFNNFVVQK